MREYRVTLILVVILGLLAGAYYFVQNKGGGEAQTDTADNGVSIMQFDRAKAVRLEIQNSDGTFAFVKKDDDAWTAETPADLSVNKDKIEDILFTLADFSAERVIDEDAKDLSVFGLDNPAHYSVKLDDGSAKNVELGNKTPTGDGYYVKLPDSNRVYTILAYKAESLQADKESLQEAPAQ